MQNKEPKILVCPLNWGLGHATRVVPIIEQLRKQKFNIYIATSGDSLLFLKKQFPKLNYINFPNYKVKYTASGSHTFKFLKAIPKIAFGTIKEHCRIKKIIKNNNFDVVISDNRYGLWNRSAYTIFITHQLNIKLPKGLKCFQPILKLIIERFITKYDECWVPDLLGNNSVAGELVQPSSLKNLYYIGLLSRYKNQKEIESVETEIDKLFVLSGPEPQRTVFEDIVYKQAGNTKSRIALVRGTSDKRKRNYSFPVYDLLNSEELLDLILKSEIVVCRSGYSSVMDLLTLNKKALLIPTPGQTEQEYLAEYLKSKGLFNTVKQNAFNIEDMTQKIFNLSDNNKYASDNVLINRIGLIKEKQYGK